MNTENIFRVAVYIGSLIICFTALSGIDFSRFLYSGKGRYAQVLLFLFSCALAYLVAEFLLGLSLK